jgi:hypothetical protein
VTATSTIQLKTIAALLEAVHQDDKADADMAVKMIKAILEAGEKKS